MANIYFVDDQVPIWMHGMAKCTTRGEDQKSPLVYRFDGTTQDEVPRELVEDGSIHPDWDMFRKLNGPVTPAGIETVYLKTKNYKSVDLFFNMFKNGDSFHNLFFSIIWENSIVDIPGSGGDIQHLRTDLTVPSSLASVSGGPFSPPPLAFSVAAPDASEVALESPVGRQVVARTQVEDISVFSTGLFGMTKLPRFVKAHSGAPSTGDMGDEFAWYLNTETEWSSSEEIGFSMNVPVMGNWMKVSLRGDQMPPIDESLFQNSRWSLSAIRRVDYRQRPKSDYEEISAESSVLDLLS